MFIEIFQHCNSITITEISQHSNSLSKSLVNPITIYKYPNSIPSYHLFSSPSRLNRDDARGGQGCRWARGWGACGGALLSFAGPWRGFQSATGAPPCCSCVPCDDDGGGLRSRSSGPERTRRPQLRAGTRLFGFRNGSWCGRLELRVYMLVGVGKRKPQ